MQKLSNSVMKVGAGFSHLKTFFAFDLYK